MNRKTEWAVKERQGTVVVISVFFTILITVVIGIWRSQAIAKRPSVKADRWVTLAKMSGCSTSLYAMSNTSSRERGPQALYRKPGKARGQVVSRTVRRLRIVDDNPKLHDDTVCHTHAKKDPTLSGAAACQADNRGILGEIRWVATFGRRTCPPRTPRSTGQTDQGGGKDDI